MTCLEINIIKFLPRDEIIQSLALKPSWKERVMAKIATFSEQDRILTERKRISDKLRRLSKAYVDGLVEEGEYDLQRKLLQSNLESLVMTEVDAAIKAGELIENLGRIWEHATLEEKLKLLASMLDAVYVDLLTNKKIVGLLPKPTFYKPFDSLNQKPNSKVIIFNPIEKENAPGFSQGR